jgi:hypothetical protein
MAENIQDKVEGEIIDWIALGSGGRLVAFKPVKGADLVVQKKGEYPAKEISLNLEIFLAPIEGKNFKKDILQSALNQTKNFFLIFLVFDEVKQKINDKIWLVPTSDFEKNAEKVKLEDGSIILKFHESLTTDPKSLFSKYLLDKKDFINLLIKNLILENKPKAKSGFKRKIYQ